MYVLAKKKKLPQLRCYISEKLLSTANVIVINDCRDQIF